METRKPVVAGILSALFPGLGQFYIGQRGKGAEFLAAALIPVGFTLWALVYCFSGEKGDMGNVGCMSLTWAPPLFLVIYLPAAIWSIVSAVRTAKRPQT